MIRLSTVFSLLALFCGGAVASPFSVSYVGTIDNGNSPFTNIVDGETYSVTLVMDNGGSSSQSQTWVASDLVSVKWEFNDSRNVVFEQNIDTSYSQYQVMGNATTDANGALTVFFGAVNSGGAVFDAVGLPDLVSPAEWYMNGFNAVFFSDGADGLGAYSPYVSDAAGGVQMNIANWSNPASAPATPSAPVATAGNAQASVTWTKPNNGGSTITGYTVTSSPGAQTCSTNDADTLTCVVTGLTNGTAYTFTVTATNVVGTSASSSASNSVTPAEPAQAAPSVPVPTLPSFLLVVLGGLLALFGIVGVRASK